VCEQKRLAERAWQKLQEMQNEIDYFFEAGTPYNNITEHKPNTSFTFALAGAQKAPVYTETQCGSCGRTIYELSATGRVGCANCYLAFENVMSEALKKCQLKIVHVGRAPHGKHNINAEYERLSRLEEAAVAEKNYEEANRLKKAKERLLREGQGGAE
jgi:protein arginine kinase activator